MFSDVLFRIRALLRRKNVEAELDVELRAHIARETEKYVRANVPREEAMRRARLALGGLEQTKEHCREARGTHLVESILQDIRYALRMLRQSPGFTVVAILTLALGMGANTAIFSLVNALALRDLPVSHPEQLVRFGAYAPDDRFPDDPFMALSLPMFQELSRGQSMLSGTFAWWGGALMNVETGAAFTRAGIWAVTGNFYSELGALPEIGRLFEPTDVDLNAGTPAPVAVLGYGFWQRHYGGSQETVGQTLKIEGVPFRIIGVTRPGFTATSAEVEPDVAVPLTAEPLLGGDSDVQKHLQRRDALWLQAAGRLKPGARIEQARAQLESLWPAVQQAMLPTTQDVARRNRFLANRMRVASGAKGDSYLRVRFLKPLHILLGIAGAVLLLACVNLASLMLARAASRAHEMGLRVALGASKPRLVRQMLTESLTLSVGGTLTGFVLAFWGSHLLAQFILTQSSIIPAELNLTPDTRILEFTAAAAILTGILFGIAPAWRATREDPNAALQQNARTLASGTGRLGRGLIITQISLSLMLLAASGLFIRSLVKLRALEPGFRTREILAAGLFPRPNGYKNLNWASYDHELLDQVSRLPAVESAGIVEMTPGNAGEWMEKAHVTGAHSNDLTSDCVMLMPGSFDVLGINLLQGRSFTWNDDEHARKVAIVSENLAKRLFPRGDAIGGHLDVTTEPKWQTLEIVGVVNNARYYNIRKPPQFTIYVPGTQYPDFMGYPDLLVQTKASPVALTEALRQVVDSFGHEYVFSVKAIRQLIDKSVLQERVAALLSIFFGALALLLGAIGLYGLMAYNVTQRTREIGIRLALGAPRSDVRWMVLRETLTLALTGIAIGVPCAIAASGLIANMLFGLTPHDPATLAMVATVLLAVGALAGYLPARRAMRVDPMAALRHE
jgi:putative ABC transport system permease protein